MKAFSLLLKSCLFITSAEYTPVQKHLKFLCLLILLLSPVAIFAQDAKTDTSFKPSGKLWGLAFGDYYYKSHSDISSRGGVNQYTGIEKGRNAFQFRRIYLGYNYEISRTFAAEVVLAAEDNIANNRGVIVGDLLSDNKLSLYIKLANIRWKNIWKGTDLLFGQMSTPAYSLTIEPIWGYRSVERTITDVRRTPSFDFGAGLQGKFDPETANYGYNLLIANGTSARPENDKYKWFYGDIWAKFFDKKLVLDLYADYNRLNWTPGAHHSRNMIKGFVGYVSPRLTGGVEAFINHGKNDVVGLSATGRDTLSANATGVSVFARGPILPSKLGFFARWDHFNPDNNYDDKVYTVEQGLTATYDPNNKEQLIILGLDYSPNKNVHFMPNLWLNRYISERGDVSGRLKKDNDTVYRITVYYVFGR